MPPGGARVTLTRDIARSVGSMPEPTTDRGNPGRSWLLVSAGGEHTCAIRADKNLWCFGQNAWGEMGDHSLGDRFIPTPVDRISIWKLITDGGGNHDCAITRQQALWCWGLNDHGQVGDGATTTRTLPLLIGTALWTTVTGGEGYTCGIQDDRSLWCWGANGKGQLGNGTRTDAHAPVQVGTDTDWASVSPGPTHTCALKTDKSLWRWGANADGEVGDGSTSLRKSPVKVGTSSWTTVSAGGRFTCGTQTGGTLWCWGFNDQGEVAQPPNSGAQITPTQVGTLTTWVQVDSATDHSCAVRTDLTLSCWGNNVSGDLGNDSAESDSPVAIPQKIWTRAITFDSMSCAWKTDDTMACWGNDTIGQLGDGSPVPSRVGPVSVVIVPA